MLPSLSRLSLPSPQLPGAAGKAGLLSAQAASAPGATLCCPEAAASRQVGTEHAARGLSG